MNKRTGRPKIPRGDFKPDMIRRLPMSHREIGVVIGATRSQVFAWSHGVGAPNADQLSKLQELCKTSSKPTSPASARTSKSPKS